MRQFLINWLGLFAVFVSMGLAGWGLVAGYIWLFENFNPVWPIATTVILIMTTICAIDMTKDMKK